MHWLVPRRLVGRVCVIQVYMQCGFGSRWLPTIQFAVECRFSLRILDSLIHWGGPIGDERVGDMTASCKGEEERVPLWGGGRGVLAATGGSLGIVHGEGNECSSCTWSKTVLQH